MLKKVFVAEDIKGNVIMSFILDSDKSLSESGNCKVLGESGSKSEIDTIKILDEGNNQVFEFDVDSSLTITRCQDCFIAGTSQDYVFNTDYELVRIKQKQ